MSGPVGFAVAPWSQVRDRVLAWGPEHYAEVGQFREPCGSRAVIPYSIDLQRLAQLEAAGMLHVVVGWDHGKLIAYHVTIIARPLHYNLLAGQGDVYYVAKSHRSGHLVLRFWATVHQTLKHRGVPILYERTKLDGPNNHSRLFEALGYQQVELVYSKWLKD